MSLWSFQGARELELALHVKAGRERPVSQNSTAYVHGSPRSTLF
jgi:hypothetical protein